MAVNLICFLTIVCCILQQGVAIKCYVCDSILNEKCRDNLNLLVPITFSSSDRVCTKFTENKGNELYIARNSIPLTNYNKDDLNGCHETTLSGIKGELCTCTKDLCNSASRRFTGIAFVIIHFALLIL